MKKFIIITSLLVAMAFVLCSCGGDAAGDNSDADGAYGANDAAAIIGGLTSDVTNANFPTYDFTSQAMVNLDHIGAKLVNRNFDRSGENNKHNATQKWIVSRLVEAGYTDQQIELQNFTSKLDDAGEVEGTNIIVTVPGEDPSKQIIAGAHYDGNGLADNGSGTALLLTTAMELHDVTPHYTIKYIFFDGEEMGCLGSTYCADQLTDDEIANTIYMINLDSLGFGDYCNIYGGTDEMYGREMDKSEAVSPTATDAYTFAANTAKNLGFNVMTTEDLDGYYAKAGEAPAVAEGTLYTNPWTPDNPAPENVTPMSPAAMPASDHVGFMEHGIQYIYFEATNWFAESANNAEDHLSYTGYIDTINYEQGEHGMFMNTPYDTWDNLLELYPGRMQQHYGLYSPLLCALLLVE